MTLRAALPLLAALMLAACGERPPERKGPPPTLITTTQARTAGLDLVERTLGTLEAVFDPRIAAEVPGRVLAVNVRNGQKVKKGELLARIDPDEAGNQAAADAADVARLEALLAQQERLVARQNELVARHFISRNALDDTSAQRDALHKQLAAARARHAIARDRLERTQVRAPSDGVIETQVASAGDYVKVGDPLFRLVSNARLRANLPFPEAAGSRIEPGMAVRLGSPLVPGATVNGVVEDIRPTVLEGSRAIEAIARIDNPGPLKSGGSVDATVVIGHKDNAVLVPEQAVVQRPAGKVVYLIAEGKASQRIVDIGARQAGMLEVVRGLAGGETLAMDGAGFLADGATVTVREPAAAGGRPAKAETPAR